MLFPEKWLNFGEEHAAWRQQMKAINH